jgi:cell division protein FtsL
MASARRKKSAKANTRTGKLFYVKLAVAIAVIEAYFAYNYVNIR